MAPTETQTLIHGYLQQSAIELLADVGMTVVPAAGSDWMPDITAILGFAGPGIAGSIALCTSTRCLHALAELANTRLPEDWLGELANQLAGRFKRRLSPHGATFGLGTPVVVAGDRLRLTACDARKRSLTTVCLESSIGRFELWLEIEFLEGFELSPQPKADGALVEGEALLF
jgi:CheY-specific phosphatase CheX